MLTVNGLSEFGSGGGEGHYSVGQVLVWLAYASPSQFLSYLPIAEQREQEGASEDVASQGWGQAF